MSLILYVLNQLVCMLIFFKYIWGIRTQVHMGVEFTLLYAVHLHPLKQCNAKLAAFKSEITLDLDRKKINGYTTKPQKDYKHTQILLFSFLIEETLQARSSEMAVFEHRSCNIAYDE